MTTQVRIPFEQENTEETENLTKRHASVFSVCFCSILVLFAETTASAVTTFELLPGSTITLGDGSVQPLHGMFAWAQGPPVLVDGVELERFDVVHFMFQSASTTFSLSSSTNLSLVLVIPDGLAGEDYFMSVYADAIGLPVSAVNLRGLYGDWSSNRITFTDFGVFDVTGTQQFASMSFSALVVPEPSVGVLWALTLLGGWFIRDLKRGNRRVSYRGSKPIKIRKEMRSRPHR